MRYNNVMHYFELFITRYFILLCVSAILYILSIQRYDSHKRISLGMIIINSLVLSLAVFSIAEEYGKDSANIPLTTVFAFLGYVIRPVCILIFILMSFKKISFKTIALASIPLVVNLIIYTFALIPATKEWVFFFHYSDDGGLAFAAPSFLRYTSHVISFGYLSWLIYVSVSKLRAKHLAHSIANFICVFFIISAVIIETFFNSKGDVFLLHSTIAVCALQYYLFLYTEKTQIDTLSGLFNRETYYHDIKSMNKSITGIIQFDINGLKYLNDNYGHLEGDKAISFISESIIKCSKKGMYGYRIGGDEFIILANNCSEEDISSVIKEFNVLMKDTSYYCSVGYAYRKNKDMDTYTLLKNAEKMMYKEKDKFYRNSPFERRKV